MKLPVFKQTTYEGCLPICLLSLSGIMPTREKELEILNSGLLKNRYGYYTANVIQAFIEQYNFDINLYVDIKLYSNFLNKLNDNKQLNIFHQFIDSNFITLQRLPFILYVDWYVFDGYTHYPHYIIVEKIFDHSVLIMEPWQGKRMEVEKGKILNSVLNLKRVLGFSPLLITLKENHE